jgi:hypothetical protein
MRLSKSARQQKGRRRSHLEKSGLGAISDRRAVEFLDSLPPSFELVSLSSTLHAMMSAFLPKSLNV